MKEPIRVLVTGAGSGVGQGIMKALRRSTLPVRTIASDIGPFNQGLYRADEAILLPRVEDPDALEKIVDALHTMHPDVVMIGSEFDLAFFSHHRESIERETGSMIVTSPPWVVDMSNDKWATAEFLRQHGLPHPLSHIPTDLDDALAAAADSLGFPCVIKPRQGTSNRYVNIVESPQSLAAIYASVPNPVLQKCIAPPSNQLGLEYTCSIFRCADGTLLGPFTARRTLRSGNSWVVEVSNFQDIIPVMERIGAVVPSMGTLNVQLIIGPDGPVPFEFNSRFSGTTAVRAYYGFNEPEMTLRSYLLGEMVPQPLIRSGMAFRYLEEIFVDDVSADGLITNPLPKGVIVPWF